MDWLGEVPEHWGLSRLKSVLQIKKKMVGANSKEYKLLSLTLQGVIPRDLDDPKGKFPAEFNAYQIVSEKDLIFCLFDVEETPRTVGFSYYRGMITGAYTVAEVKEEKNNSKYYYYYYYSRDQYKALKMFYTGLRNVIRKQNFLDIPCPVPPSEEQFAIVNFLDQETEKIDSLILEQEKLITLLSEKRQAMISHVVTEGLDPSVPMKDSGVEWLGEVPEHWEVKKLKYVSKILTSNIDKKSYPNDTPVKLCNYTDVYYNHYITQKLKFMDATARSEQIKKFTLQVEDTIITKDSESATDIAISAYVPQDMQGIVCGYHLAIVRPKAQINGLFIKYYFDSAFLKAQVFACANGLTRVGLSQYSLNNLMIPLPPYEEQTIISIFLSQETQKMDSLVNEAKKAIELLKERRSALISAAVTGQIDVRDRVS